MYLLLTLHTEHPVRWNISPFILLCFVFLRFSSCIRQYLYRFTFPVVLGATILSPPPYWGEPMQKMKSSISIHCLASIKIIHEPGKYSTVLHCSSVTCLWRRLIVRVSRNSRFIGPAEVQTRCPSDKRWACVSLWYNLKYCVVGLATRVSHS